MGTLTMRCVSAILLALLVAVTVGQDDVTVPTSTDGAAATDSSDVAGDAKVVLQVPVTTPTGNRTVVFREGQDVQTVINEFVAAEGLGTAEASAILSHVVGVARKPLLSLPMTTPNGDRVLDLFDGEDVRPQVLKFCQDEGLTQAHYQQIIDEVVRRAQPKKYAFTVSVQVGEANTSEGLRVLHFFENDAVNAKVLEFCNALGLGQEAFDAILEHVKQRAQAQPLMSLPFDTPVGSQTLKIYPEDTVPNACHYFVHALGLGEAELQAVFKAVQTQIQLLQRDQYNNILDLGTNVFLGLDADSSGLLSAGEQQPLQANGDDSAIDLNGDGSVDFFEFMATRSANLTALSATTTVTERLDASMDTVMRPFSNGLLSTSLSADGLGLLLSAHFLSGNATALFQALDADESSSLSVTEMKALRSVLLNRATLNSAFDSAIKAFERADTSGDGALSDGELKVLTTAADALSALDHDSNGEITFVEFMAAAMSQPMVHAASNYTAGLLVPADAGGVVFTGRGVELVVDTVLSLFRRYDENQDGSLNETEQINMADGEFTSDRPSDDVIATVLPKGSPVTREAFRDSLFASGRGQVFVSKAASLRRGLAESAQKGIHALSPTVFNATKENTAESPSLPAGHAICSMFM